MLARRAVLAARLAIAVRLAIVVVVVAIGVVRFAAIDAGSDSASDTLRPFVLEMIPVVLVAAFLWLVIRRLGERPR